MDTLQQRYGRTPPALDGYAIAKGWFSTVGLWLGSTLALAIFADVASAGETDMADLDNVAIWPIIAACSVLVAMFAGLPLALLFDRLLRRVHMPWVHAVAFLCFFALLPGIPLWMTAGSDAGVALWFCLLLGACAGIGRTLAFRRHGEFRRPTTWA